ncbi:MAG: hypothetical protein GX421_03250 [Caldisericales bacterium]|nr:hypothetical protein [Caldisericales bacterium]
MSKKLLWGFVATLGLVAIIIVAFMMFNPGDKPKNTYSQLYLTVVPVNSEKPDWETLKKAIEARVSYLGELRFFENMESHARLVITGSEDPNEMGSMLLVQGKTLLITDKGQKVATDDEFESAMPVSFKDTTGSYGIAIQLNDTGKQRLLAMLNAKDKPSKIQLVLDEVPIGAMKFDEIGQDGTLSFHLRKGMRKSFAELLSRVFITRLPFKIAGIVNSSYFVAPQSDVESPLNFVDFLYEARIDR